MKRVIKRKLPKFQKGVLTDPMNLSQNFNIKKQQGFGVQGNFGSTGNYAETNNYTVPNNPNPGIKQPQNNYTVPNNPNAPKPAFNSLTGQYGTPGLPQNSYFSVPTGQYGTNAPNPAMGAPATAEPAPYFNSVTGQYGNQNAPAESAPYFNSVTGQYGSPNPAPSTVQPNQPVGAPASANQVRNDLAVKPLKAMPGSYGSATEQLKTTAMQTTGQLQQEEDNKQELDKIKNPEKIQFFNPYGQVDIPTAAMTLGSSIENGNALGIVGSGLKLATGLGRNVLGGIGTQRRNNQVMEDYWNTQRNDLTRPEMAEDGGYFGGDDFVQYIPEFKKGGEVELSEALTGEYIGGMDKENPMVEPNAEIEKDEVLQHPNGEIQTAKGDTHESGGIDVNLEEGTKILSDHLKVGGDLARKLSKKYDIKVNASDTYARVIEKHDKKSGLTNTNDEQEKVIKQLEEQDKIKDEETLGINVQHLSNKINDLENTKKPLKEARKGVFSELFDAQEKSKPKNEKEEEMFQDGGIIKALSEKYGISQERAMELAAPMMQDGGHLPKLQDGKWWENIGGGVNMSGNMNKPEGMSDVEFFQQKAMEKNVTNVAGSAPKYTEQEKQIIKSSYTKIVKDKTSLDKLYQAIDSNSLVYNPGMLKALQEGKRMPLELQHADSAGTYGGQDEDKLNGYLYKDVLGGDFKPGDKKYTEKLYGIIKGDLQKQGVDWQGSPFYNRITAGIGNVNEQQPGFVQRGKARKDGSIDLDKFRKQSPGAKQLVADEYGVSVESIEEQTKNTTNKFLKLTKDMTPAPINNTGDIKPAQPVQTEQIQGVQGVAEQEAGKGKGLYFPILPDQTPMRPDSLQPHLKTKRRFDRVNPALISPEQNIVELNRNVSSAMDSFKNLPGTQNAAAMASLSANTQDNINKAFQQANTFNSQATAQADGRNAQIQAMEENAAAQDALSYEQRMFRAKSLTDNDNRNYYNTIQANNVRNYNEVNNLNAANAMADHYQYDGQSFVQMDTPSWNIGNQDPAEVEKKRLIAEQEAKLAAKNKSKKKLGGRFSKKK